MQIPWNYFIALHQICDRNRLNLHELTATYKMTSNSHILLEEELALDK